jgi:hypothetical protein
MISGMMTAVHLLTALSIGVRAMIDEVDEVLTRNLVMAATEAQRRRYRGQIQSS